MRQLFYILLSFYSVFALAENELTLVELENKIISADLKLKQFDKQTQSLQHAEIYQAVKPDMQFKITALNLALAEPLNFTKEPLTQIVLGASQQYLRGDTLNLKKSIAQSSTKISVLDKAIYQRKIIKTGRTLWLATFMANAQLLLINEQISVFKDLLPIALGRYKVGRGTQQDVIKVRLKISQLHEKIIELEGEIESSKARLSQWDALIVTSKWPVKLPSKLKIIPTINKLSLKNHPEIKQLKQQHAKSKQQIHLIKESYKPSMKLSVSYGLRDTRGDVFSVGLQSDLPWIDSNNTVDEKVREQEQKSEAIMFAYKNKVQEMKAQIKQQHSLAKNYQKRLGQYKNEILPELVQISSVILGEYQTGESSLSDLLIARDAEIRNATKMLMLTDKKAKTIINLHYLLQAKP